MKRIIIAVIMVLSFATFSYCANIDMGELVEQYKHATDIQKQELEKNYLGSRITGRGVVENVGEYNFFDINTDTGENYYRVITRQQDTLGKTPYQVIFMYKNKDMVKDISRGETVEKEGTLINIVDERLQISVWVYEGELTQKDRELFQLESRKSSL